MMMMTMMTYLIAPAFFDREPLLRGRRKRMTGSGRGGRRGGEAGRGGVMAVTTVGLKAFIVRLGWWSGLHGENKGLI